MRTPTRGRLTTALTICLAITGIGATTTACNTTNETPPVSIGSQNPLGGPSNLAGTSTSKKAPDVEAQDQAKAVVRQYLSLYSDLSTGKENNLDKLASLAGDPLLQSVRGDLIAVKSRGVKVTGAAPILSATVVRTDLPENGQGQADVEVITCTDQSQIKATFPDGKSALTDSPDRLQRRWWVRNAGYPDATKWRVVGQSLKANTPCAG